MTEKLVRAALAAVLVLALGACSSGSGESPDAGYVADSGTIPDVCTQAAPCPLTPGTKASEYVAPAADEDPYTFEVPSAGSIVQVVVSNDADFSPIRLEVALFDPSGSALVTKSFTGNGKQKIDIQLVAAMAGTYKLVVRDTGNDAADRRNPYFVLVALLSQTDTNEPNDTAATATTLTADQPKSGTIGAEGEVDWFAIDVAEDQILDVQLSWTPARSGAGQSPVRFRYELYAPDGTTRVAESTEPSGALGSTTGLRENRAVGNVAGRYLIKVMDDPSNGAQADLTRSYILTVGLLAEPDEYDLAAPNETPATATSFPAAGQTITGYIASKADADYYAIRVPAASPEHPALITVEATMDPASPVDLAFSVLDTNGRDLVCAEDDVCKAFRFVPDDDAPVRPPKLATAHVVRAPGRYFVVVRDNQDNDFDVATPYTLKIDLPTEPDLHENYASSRDGAVPIHASTSTASAVIQYPWVEGYLSYADDVDWYSFDFPGPMGAPPTQNGDWLIQLDIQKPGPTPVELEVFLSASDLDYGGYGPRCGTPAPGDPDPTGLACQYPDDQNAVDASFGEAHGDCLVVFREHTRVGPHYVRVTDLNRDDFDVRPGAGAYRFRLTLTAKCTPSSHCAGMYHAVDGSDLCSRP